MKLLFDLFPIVLFFLAYKVYDIYVATLVAITAAFLQIVFFWLKHKRFEKMHVITFLMIFFLGGLTVVLKDPRFLMWKVSVVNVVFALIFLGSFFIGEKTIAERMFGAVLEANEDTKVNLPKKSWSFINTLWAGMFLLIALVNVLFVLPALSARDKLLDVYPLKESETIKEIDCSTIPSEQLCAVAQQTEASWVNFKLFGSMGITFVVVIITIAYLMKYMKGEE